MNSSGFGVAAHGNESNSSVQEMYSHAVCAEALQHFIQKLPELVDHAAIMRELASSLRFAVDVERADIFRMDGDTCVRLRFIDRAGTIDYEWRPAPAALCSNFKRWWKFSGRLTICADEMDPTWTQAPELLSARSVICNVSPLALFMFQPPEDAAYVKDDIDHLWRCSAIAAMGMQQAKIRQDVWEARQRTVEIIALRKSADLAIHLIGPKSRRSAPSNPECGLAGLEQSGVDACCRGDEEAQTEQEETDVQSALEAIADATICVDLDGKVTRMNAIAEKLIGRRSADARGKALNEVFRLRDEFPDRECCTSLDFLLTAGQPVRLGCDKVLMSLDGKERQLVVAGAPLRSEMGDCFGVIVVFRDVSPEFAMQRQQRQTEKLQAIGLMAGGIAHDFNNLLAGIGGAADVISIREGHKLSQGSLGLLASIQDTVKKASELTTKLIAFARKGAPTFTIVALPPIIDEVVGILTRKVNKSISISYANHADEIHALGGAGVLQSALLNIGLNACHAMPNGGSLAIEMRNVELDQRACDHSGFELSPGQFIEVMLTDTGVGISPENIQKIFDPFFTTKEFSAGAGLGLSTVYGAIRDHRGAIFVDSAIGRGSSFRILLPCAKAPSDLSSTVEGAEIKRSQWRVLLVDDDRLLCEVGYEMLVELGCVAVVADNATKALDVFHARCEEFDLVILDVNMPVMNGAEMVALLKAAKPDCRIVIATGFAEPEIIGELHRLGVDEILCKPYSIKTLRDTVHRVLETARASA